VLVSLCGAAGDAHISATWEVDDATPGGFSHPELASAIGRALGKGVIALPLPQAVLMAFAHADRIMRGPRAKLTPDRVRYMCHPDWVIDEARRPPAHFWQPAIGLDEGLAEVAASMKA
jgi:hypothetical protein